MSELGPRRGEIITGEDVLAAYMAIEDATGFAMQISGELDAAKQELKERVGQLDIDVDNFFAFDQPVPVGLIVEAMPSGDIGDLTIRKALAWQAVKLLKEKRVGALNERLMPGDAPAVVLGVTKIVDHAFDLLLESGATTFTNKGHLEGVVTRLSDKWIQIHTESGKNYIIWPARREYSHGQPEPQVQIEILEN